MSQIITAVVENGMLRPDEPLNLPPQTRVRLTVELLPLSPVGDDEAWQEFEQACEEISRDFGGVRLTRDQLHERR